MAAKSLVSGPLVCSRSHRDSMATKTPKHHKTTSEKKKTVATLTHEEASRKNIPTAEFQSVMHKEEQSPIRVAYERRNRDLDPQLVWRGKDEQDWSDLVTHAPPIYIQEKVHPKVLIDDLVRRSAADRKAVEDQIDLFADFNGVPDGNAKTEFYQHDANWSNRMILGDSLQVMASLAEREGLRGQVQCIYLDPPYGIKFNSNFQWSTTSRDVKDGNVDHITREPEQVKAFRDTWRDGIHSYLTYLRDRLTVARDLLNNSGSVFVQISDENVHRVRSLLDEVFGADNAMPQLVFRKTTGAGSPSGYVDSVPQTFDYLLWYTKNRSSAKIRRLFFDRRVQDDQNLRWLELPDGTRRGMTAAEVVTPELIPANARVFRPNPITSQSAGDTTVFSVSFEGGTYRPSKGGWKTNATGMARLSKSHRLTASGSTLGFIRYLDDFPHRPIIDIWDDTRTSGFGDAKTYVVQTSPRVIARSIMLTTDPGDLVIDPTCGSGTTAYVAEQWGRRWITIDTSRVALALARARIMGARYPYYLLADSKDGQQKEAELTKSVPPEAPAHGDIRQGFVYERVPHIALKSIANNTEIDVIWEKFQGVLEPLREQLIAILKQKWEEWEIPREADDEWPEKAKKLHAEWWLQRIARQKEIDASIAAKADLEYLYDKPYDDKRKVRVAGPFTVESLTPHRVLAVDENDELIDATSKSQNGDEQGFVQMILENLKTAGVQQAHKEDKVAFSSITPWPGYLVCAEGRYIEGAGTEKRAAIFIGPEFGTVSRPDLVAAAREAGDSGFDVLIACAFNYDAHSAEFDKLGRIPVLKARMNADLHMADDLKNTGKGNLFVIFGEPDIDILNAKDGQIQVKVNGVDVFHPNTGEVRSNGADGIACWFIDTDYNEESFFVRHAYFLGANDPYKSLKTTLKAEVNEEAWATLNSDTSRPFDKPKSGRIAVKVINHLGDEVMKVFRVDDPRK
jgi:adenine-specific DNA-methyltransferase